MRCPNCSVEVERKIHEGTGQKLYYLPGGEVIHKCKPRMKWCVKCGISVIDNGKHDHSKFEQRRRGLDRFT